MKLKYKTDDNDYIDFYEFNARSTRQGKKSMLIQKASVPVILALVTVCTLVFSLKPLIVAIEVVLYAVFSWMWWKYQDKSLRKNAGDLLQRLQQKGQTPYSKEGFLDFGEQEIQDHRFGKTLELQYSNIASVYQNNGAVYIYMSEGNRVILMPASVFTGETTSEAFLEFLKQKVSTEKFM